MTYNKKTVKDIDVSGQTVLVRVDFNVPLKDGQVSDDTRIRATLPTIDYLLANGAALILFSHLGRPRGQRSADLSLKPVANHLAELIGMNVGFVDDSIGPKVTQVAAKLEPGQILLLENTRFHSEEKKNDPEFAKELASLGDIFVNDAFGSAHRAHASTTGIATQLPALAGLLMEKELTVLEMVIGNPAHPFIAILGGAKIADKIGVVRSFLKQADQLLLGGGMANTFLAAQGFSMGDSLVESESIEQAKEFLGYPGGKIHLPIDVVVADVFSADAARQVVAVDAIPVGWQALDIGPKTIQAYAKALSGAKLVVWNGPMGVFEFPAFAKGTNELAQYVAQSDAMAIIGGGDSAAAIKQAGLEDQIDHVSTGGGATLAFLGGESLPGVEAMDDL
jgi:phosphoglycerate kinase